MPTKPPALSRLREDVVMQAQPAQGQGLQHDAQQHVVRELKVVGLESKKGRRYPPEVLKEALALYEGAKCNVDHVSESKPDVPFASRFGVFRNVKLLGDGLWADLYYNPAHALAESFVWWSQFEPDGVGFSHDVLGESKIDADGSQVVSRIHHVYSVDLVANPASTKGLRESDMPDPMPTADTGTEPGYDEHLCNAITAVVKDDSMDGKAKKAKINQLLKVLDKGEEETESEDGKDSGKKKESDDDMDEDKAMESLRKRDDPASKKALELLESNAREKQLAARKVAVVKIATDAGLPAESLTEVFTESLIAARDDEHVKRLVEDRRRHASGKKPISAPAGGGAGQLTTDQFVAGMRGK